MKFVLGLTDNSPKPTADTRLLITFPGLTTLGDILKLGATYIPTGPQYFTAETKSAVGRGSTPFGYNYMQAIKANKVGAGDERLMVGSNGDKNRSDSAVNANVLFFQRG